MDNTPEQLKITDDSSNSNAKHESSARKIDRPSSPDASCVICLEKLENNSFTDSCFHQFCFTCLLEWSKVKPECPLCKQPFKSIIHNVRSIEDYDQYHLRNEDSHNSWESPEGRRFRYRSTLTQERRCEIALERLLLGRVHRPGNPVWNRPYYLNSVWNRPCISNSEFRQTVYEQNWWALPIEQMQITRSRFRNVSPSFFHANPACTHRLVPWLNRELVVLLSNHESQISFVLELMLSLIQRYEIRSPEFREHVRTYIFGRTDHFIHEFYNFARSPWDMAAYDRHVIYQNGSTEVSSSRDSDVIILSPSDSTSHTNTSDSTNLLPENTSSVIVDTISQDEVNVTSTISHALNGNGSGTSETYHNPVLGRVKTFLSEISIPQRWETLSNVSISPSWNSPGQSFSNTSENFPTYHTPSPQPGPSGVNHSTIVIKESSESDSSNEDECYIVGYVKPMKDRSPLIIDLVSDSNDDSTEENAYLNLHKEKKKKYRKLNRSSSSSREREYHSPRQKKRKSVRDIEHKYYRSRSSSSSSYTRMSSESRSKSSHSKHLHYDKSSRSNHHKRTTHSPERWQWTAYENGGGKLQKTTSSSDELSQKSSKEHLNGHVSRKKHGHNKHKHKKHKKHKRKHKSSHKDEKPKKHKDRYDKPNDNIA